MNKTVDLSSSIQIIVTTEGIFGIILNITAITVVFTSQFGSKFTTFVFRAQPIFDLSACFITAIYYIIQFTNGYNKFTGLYIIDRLLCHFWFQNSLFWLPCILSVQNLVCISLDRMNVLLSKLICAL
uniref:G_PROTEIN_RECEP_F1_2 domain-containing protein n=1 Tax=Schistosoma mansoni TaxID=6183 RepID=A0A5K4F6M7_SCHMA